MLESCKNKAVILSLYDTGLATVRCLGRIGIEVVGFDYDVSQPGFRSRYCTSIQCPNPTDHPQAMLDLLLRNADPANPAVLFPCSDEFVHFVSRHREALKKAYAFLLPDCDLLEQLIHKDLQLTMIHNLGIPTPRFQTAESMEEADHLKDKITYPAFIKPVQGHVWRKFYDNKGFIAENPSAWLTHCRHIFPKGLKIIAQTIIPGPASNNWEISAYVNAKGQLIGEFVIQKIRQYPSDFGFATMTMTACNAEVERLGRRIIDGLALRGFINIEFKFDPKVRDYQFIELNPRVWQQVNHPERLGLNFPLMQYLDLVGMTTDTLKKYPKGDKWMDLKWDIISSITMIRRQEMSVRQWLVSLNGTRCQGLFAFDDLHPFLYSLNYGVSFIKALKFLMRRSQEK